MTVAVSVVAVMPAGAWNTVEAAGTDAGSDVVCDVVNVQLA